MKIPKSIYSIIFLSLAAGIGVSCNSENEETSHAIFEKYDTIAPPVVIRAGKPISHNLSTENPPEIVLLSQRPKPIVTPAGFFVDMQNFNTEQGLALSSILCGFMDSSGRLWFGTSGNGVSMYDGKKFNNYNSSHGLIHNLINTITQDSNGNIWFGTYGGVSKYDGKTFENFTTENGLVDNDVLKITEESNGTIWMGTDKGLCSFNQNSDQKSIIRYDEDNGVSRGIINDIIEDRQGNLWIAGSQGILKSVTGTKSKEKTFINVSEKFGINDFNEPTAVLEDNEGIIWAASKGSIYRYGLKKNDAAEKTFKPLTIADGLVDKTIYCLTQDIDGNIWMGTDGGVSKYSTKTGKFINFSTQQGLSFNRVNSITQDSSGSLWFGTYGGGLDRYDGETIVGYTGAQGFPGNAVYATTLDDEGEMWFAPSTAGIVKYVQVQPGFEGSFINYTTDQGLLENTNYAATRDKEGSLWFGGNNGLSKFTGEEFINFTKEQGLPANYITTVYSDKEDNLWIGTFENGISIFKGNTFSNFSKEQGLVHKTVWDFCEGTDGSMWIATRGGLSRFDGTNFMNFTKDQGLPDNKLSSVLQDKNGNIIIGSWGGGISIIKKEVLEKIKNHKLTISDTIFKNFSTAQGLANDVVYQILEHESGDIVIGTNEGFTVLKGGVASGKGKIAKDGVENFNEKTGYSIKDISNNASMREDAQGMLWAGTGDKLVRFNLSKVHKNPSPLQVFLQDIKINNETISWRSLAHARQKERVTSSKDRSTAYYGTDEVLTLKREVGDHKLDSMVKSFKNVQFDSVQPFYAIPKNLELPYTKNNISFEFVGVETTRPKLVLYQYMLKGYDVQWNPVTENTTATFGNMHEGDYTFLIKAKSPDGIWSEPLQYSFKIRPPWYRSWYALLFYISIFLITIFFIDKFQRQRIAAKEKQKTMRRELRHAKEIEKAYTELKTTQVQLIQSEKMASLGELTAGIAHEIQNPLNFVNNFSEVSNEMIVELQEERSKNNGARDEGLENEILDDIKQNLEKINHHGKRAEAIVKGMLQHSRSSSGKKEPININALTDEYLRLAYHGLRAKDKSFHATLETDYDKSIGKVDIIPQDMGRVFLNLITNAFYACTERSRSSVNEKSDFLQAKDGKYEPTIWVRTKKVGDTVLVSVRDNGNGMPQHIVDKIFLPFFTTKPAGQGTGLGLSMSYDIVTKAHGGTLKVDTKEGEGTTFTIQIPKL